MLPQQINGIVVGISAENEAKHDPCKRRASLGRMNGTQRLFRTNSMSRFPSLAKHILNKSWRNDSSSTFCSSDLSVDKAEEAAMALLRQLNKHIVELQDLKVKLDEQIASNYDLAKARISNGCCKNGALLSMKKAVRHKITKAYTSGARYQLIELSKQAKTELEHIRAAPSKSSSRSLAAEFDTRALREAMQDVLDKLESIPYPNLSDEDLFCQLEQMML